MKQYHRQLSDTEALTGRPLRPAELCTADEPPKAAHGSADRAVTGPGTGRYSRATGAGSESLAAAVAITSCEE